MRPHVYICVNGILSNPGDAEGWTDRAVTWLHLHTQSKAEKFEYACGALTRRLRQRRRAEAIARMCEYYFNAGYAITLVGHSNGCDLIARVLKLEEHRQFVGAHLFAPAADADAFTVPLRRQLGRLNLYVSAGDRALMLAGLSQSLFGWAGLGYGSLGREVPMWLTYHLRVAVTRRDGYGHSTWFERGKRFEQTMELLRQNESTATPSP